jgi:hypothetical protein
MYDLLLLDEAVKRLVVPLWALVVSSGGTAEIKRMFVETGVRRQNIASRLLEDWRPSKR